MEDAQKTSGAGRRISSGGVIFRRIENVIEVALISVKAGKVWGLPKGMSEAGENLARTAHREVREETGLDGKILNKIGHIEYFFTIKDEAGPKRLFKIVYFFLMEYTSGDTSMHDHEVIDCQWFPIDHAIRLMKFDDEKGILRKAKKMINEHIKKEPTA